MPVVLTIFVFVLSAGSFFWAMWMLTDWLYHGRPDRFKT